MVCNIVNYVATYVTYVMATFKVKAQDSFSEFELS